MSFEEESRPTLKELVTDTLQANGTLEKIQAQLRASIFLSLEEESKEKNIPLVNIKTQQLLSSPLGATALGFVKDFLECLDLDFTLAVLIPESRLKTIDGVPETSKLLENWKIDVEPTQTGTKVPALFSLIEHFQESVTPPVNQNGTSTNTTDEILTGNNIVSLPEEANFSSKNTSDAVQSSVKSQNYIDSLSCKGDDTTDDKESISGSNSKYNDEFSSSTEKDHTSRGGKDTEIDEVDIEEDLSLNDIISTQSEVSDNTKDVTLYDDLQTPRADYVESL